MNRIKWGIIGCGDVTEVKSGPGFQKAENSELVAVMRRNGKLASDYARRHHVPKWYDNADDLINDPDVNAVYIATPPAYHKEYALKCAKARKPVYVEKPMATTYKDCLEMLEACRETGTPIFVAYYRRALDYFIKVKELVDGGAIGEIRFVSVRQSVEPFPDAKNSALWRLDPKISGGGLFHDLASHTLDILDYILGPVVRAKGNASNQSGQYAVDDMVTAHFEFSSGAHGIGAWCFNAFKTFDENEIIGSKGRISFSTYSPSPVILETKSGRDEFTFTNPLHIQQPLIQSVVNALNSVGKAPSDGVTASRTNWVMDEIMNYEP